jgi:hypothetical protein
VTGLTDEQYIVLFTFLGSLPPLSYAIAKSWSQLGATFFLLSPLPVFSFAYLCAFVLKPLVETLLPFRYPFTVDLEYETFLWAQGYAVLSVYAFAIAYSSFFNERIPRKLTAKLHTAGRHPLRTFQSVAASISLLLAMTFFLVLWNWGLITLDIGENRVAYLNTMHGTGYIFLINNAVFVFFVISCVLSLWTKQLSITAVLALLLMVVSNTFVSNRSFVTIILFSCLLLYIIDRHRKGFQPSATRLLSALIALVFLGAAIGLMRGTEDYGNQDFISYIFLLLTFDMSETFQSVIMRHELFDLGASWVEDVVFTHLPRLIFEDKPNMYGAMRLQIEYMPESAPVAGVFNATYPLGIFGESYANFGLPGTLASLFFLGATLKFLYYRTLANLLSAKLKLAGAGTLLLYTILCANSLGYIRSFGWFLAGLIFLTFLFLLCLLITIAVGSLVEWRVKKVKPANSSQ